jgi:hypothetical protein
MGDLVVAAGNVRWDAVGAVVTLILAAVTVWLASETRRMASATRDSVRTSYEIARAAHKQVEAAQEQVRATNEQAALARATLEASIQPILADVPSGVFLEIEEISLAEDVNQEERGPLFTMQLTDRGDLIVADRDRFVFCSIPFRNTGSGTAMIRGIGIRFGEAEWSGARASRMVVPPGELTRVSIFVPKDRSEISQHIPNLVKGYFDMSVMYTNINGTQPVVTRALVWRYPDKGYRVRQIFLSRWGESEPFAASGPADG